MNILKLGLWGVVFLFSINIIGQNSEIVHKTINWEEPIDIELNDNMTTLLNFSNMGEIDSETNLPKLNESIALPLNVKPSSVRVKITNEKYVWPDPKEHISHINKISNPELQFNYDISLSGNISYLNVSLIPLIKKESSPTFQKLTSFDLEITYDFNKEASLKSVSTLQFYSENSVLSQGNWIKVKVTESGIHKITYSELQNWGISNPQKVGIFGNGGSPLPEDNSKFREDDLVENAIWHFNNAVYFYAEGPVVWNYNTSTGMYMHTKNPFTEHSYYFITEKDAPSKHIEQSNLQNEVFDNEVDYFNDFDYHELNNLNLFGSGSKWFGERFVHPTKLEQYFDFNFPNISPRSQVKAYIALASSSFGIATFSAEINDSPIGSTQIFAITPNDHLGYKAREGILKGSTTSQQDLIKLKVIYNPSSSVTSSVGYLDYICINANRKLTYTENEIKFRNIDAVETGTFTKYNIDNSNQNIHVWDITDILNPLKVNTNFSNGTTSFVYNSSELKSFVAFDPSGGFPSPAYINKVENQNLHSLPNVEYLIVCHPDYLDQAKRLGEIHKEFQGLSYAVATTEQIYNEFSSGKPDVTAIRNFAKMFYDRAGDNESLKPKNLLLFGDGTYDNRENIEGNPNKILTYQSANSIHQTNSFVSDDYFGLLDDSDGTSITSDKLDIGVGRFPVSTIEQAKNAVDKSENYLSNQSLDNWKNRLTFVGDDKDSNIHMQDANRLATKVDTKYPQFNINKIYFDSFEKVKNAVNERYPDVEKEIYDAIHEGTLIFNYTGHGGTEGLAHESIITKAHIESWSNINRLPIFITATCEFSRFDDFETSAGEMVFLNPIGGAIALFTTTRIVYSSLNFILNNNLYDNIFEHDDMGNPLTFGEIMRRTKISSGTSVNKRNFTLLGDPALKPIYPELVANTVTINEQSINEPLDSLKALSHNHITGNITNALQVIENNFNGKVYISVFDKKSQLFTLDNNNDGAFQYEAYDNLIFKGISKVTNGEFESDFIIPKDIRYNFDNAKISYYAYSDDNSIEAFGAYDEFIVGGLNENASEDNKGPEIQLWMNNKSFKNGGETTSMPTLIAEISDESGINTTGNGIGHDIVCYIDGDKSKSIILNDQFQTELNSYTKGNVYYQLSNLEPGKHTLSFKAWDTHNNSSESNIAFIVSENNEAHFKNAKSYPNPVVRGASTYFYFELDEPNVTLDVTIDIYTLSGQLIDTEKKSVVSLNNTIPPIEWQADTEPGLYIYRLSILTQTERKGEVSGKIMVTQ